jgi:hypothetical protein
MDTFSRWLEALEERHMRALSFQEVRRSVQALSSLYVQRRDRLSQGSALDGAGKRAAFALYFGPLHFLLVQEIIKALGADAIAVPSILDLGCGTGVAGAAWASTISPSPPVSGVDRNPWAASEARWTYGVFGLAGSTKATDINTFKAPDRTAIVAAFIVNELGEEGRQRWRDSLLRAGERGRPVLVIEPIAKKLSPWWDEWADAFIAAGGRSDEWRFPVELPERLALMDKAAGLNHRELTGRSLWLSGRVKGDGPFIQRGGPFVNS